MILYIGRDDSRITGHLFLSTEAVIENLHAVPLTLCRIFPHYSCEGGTEGGMRKIPRPRPKKPRRKKEKGAEIVTLEMVDSRMDNIVTQMDIMKRSYAQLRRLDDQEQLRNMNIALIVLGKAITKVNAAILKALKYDAEEAIGNG